MRRIAIFASGSGSNAENIFNYFHHSKEAQISLFLTNNSKAKVVERAKRLDVDCICFTREDLCQNNYVAEILAAHKIDYIVLAGFLWLLPTCIIEKYEGRILNIHPALLPKYGGKGMYGDRVHQAVVDNHETESGITIHLVNNVYDSGQIIAQFKTPVLPDDTAESLANRVHQLEYEHFPEVIENEIKKLSL